MLPLLPHSYMARLAIFTSAEQKLFSSPPIFNSIERKRYFTFPKGVTVNSFIDESHRLFFSTVSSSSEREAAYVFDGLLHNEVVKSDMHSTDTHGYAEVIFGTAYLLGLVFAPRIKGVQDQQLYAFEKRKTYEKKGFKILPQKYINTDAIEEQWGELLRLIATIKLKETTASQIFLIRLLGIIPLSSSSIPFVMVTLDIPVSSLTLLIPPYPNRSASEAPYNLLCFSFNCGSSASYAFLLVHCCILLFTMAAS